MDNERESKLKALQLTVDRLEKAYGKGTVMRLGDKQIIHAETIPSGSLGLDIALGINGFPKGRVVEIYGPESSGKTTLAILIFQDIIIVPMILFIPILAGETALTGQSILLALLKGAGVIVLVLLGARFVVPRILYQIAKTQNRELFLLTIIVTGFATAWLTYSIGLSLALGAFIAGLIISESEYSEQAFGDIIPFRDLFTSFFFVSVGMLLDIRFIIDVYRSFGVENAQKNLDLTLQHRPKSVIGIGLGGAEETGPARDYAEIFEQAAAEDLRVVAHAGEVLGPESIWAAEARRSSPRRSSGSWPSACATQSGSLWPTTFTRWIFARLRLRLPCWTSSPRPRTTSWVGS